MRQLEPACVLHAVRQSTDGGCSLPRLRLRQAAQHGWCTAYPPGQDQRIRERVQEVPLSHIYAVTHLCASRVCAASVCANV